MIPDSLFAASGNKSPQLQRLFHHSTRRYIAFLEQALAGGSVASLGIHTPRCCRTASLRCLGVAARDKVLHVFQVAATVSRQRDPLDNRDRFPPGCRPCATPRPNSPFGSRASCRRRPRICERVACGTFRRTLSEKSTFEMLVNTACRPSVRQLALVPSLRRGQCRPVISARPGCRSCCCLRPPLTARAGTRWCSGSSDLWIDGDAQFGQGLHLRGPVLRRHPHQRLAGFLVAMKRRLWNSSHVRSAIAGSTPGKSFLPGARSCPD